MFVIVAKQPGKLVFPLGIVNPGRQLTPDTYLCQQRSHKTHHRAANAISRARILRKNGRQQCRVRAREARNKVIFRL
jgi:hypothetical protein